MQRPPFAERGGRAEQGAWLSLQVCSLVLLIVIAWHGRTTYVLHTNSGKVNLCKKGQASKNTDKWTTKSCSLLPKANKVFLKVSIFAATAKKAQNRKNARLKVWKLTIFYLSKSRNSRAVEWEELSGYLCPVYLWGSPVPTHVLQCNQHFMQWWKLDHLTKFGSAVDAFAYPSFAFESRRQPLLTMYQRNNVNQALYPTPNINILYSFLLAQWGVDKYLDHYVPINENLTLLGQEFAAV